MTSIPPSDLTVRIFKTLYPEYKLLTIGGTYVVYPPYAPERSLVYISESLGRIAHQIFEDENPGIELVDLIEDSVEPLPRRFAE